MSAWHFPLPKHVDFEVISRPRAVDELVPDFGRNEPDGSICGGGGQHAHWPTPRTDRLRRVDHLVLPSSRELTPPAAFGRSACPGGVQSTSNAFQKCFGSGECQAAAESGKAPRGCHLLCLGQVADPTTATVRTGRSSTGHIRDFEPAKSLQIAHFEVRVHCGRRRGASLWRSCCPARL